MFAHICYSATPSVQPKHESNSAPAGRTSPLPPHTRLQRPFLQRNSWWSSLPSKQRSWRSSHPQGQPQKASWAQNDWIPKMDGWNTKHHQMCLCVSYKFEPLEPFPKMSIEDVHIMFAYRRCLEESLHNAMDELCTCECGLPILLQGRRKQMAWSQD